MLYDSAVRIAGMLYGNILHRNADDDGFNYYFNELLTDAMTTKEAIKDFFCSGEFVETFVLNQTPNELARNLLSSLYNPSASTDQEVKSLALELVRSDFPTVMASLIDDVRFFDRNGLAGVPRYVELAHLETASR